MSTQQLLQLLADGQFHSGQDIAESLGCSRSAIWKRIGELRQLPGIDIDSVTGRGYRLNRPLELLDREQIMQGLPKSQRGSVKACHVCHSIDSTNNKAAEADLLLGQGEAWFAEHQTAGRGRRGRSWISPYAQNIYFSLAWRFDAPLVRLAGLSLAIGASLALLLQQQGLKGHGLKWPNDLLWDKRKLAGILVEVNGESEGPANAILGVGINLDMDLHQGKSIDQPYSSLAEAGLNVSRNNMAHELLSTCIQTCELFQREGLSAFLDIWRGFDLFKGQPVRLLGPGQSHTGKYLGLADDGGLRLQEDATERVYYAGELSLRLDHLHE